MDICLFAIFFITLQPNNAFVCVHTRENERMKK